MSTNDDFASTPQPRSSSSKKNNRTYSVLSNNVTPTRINESFLSIRRSMATNRKSTSTGSSINSRLNLPLKDLLKNRSSPLISEETSILDLSKDEDKLESVDVDLKTLFLKRKQETKKHHFNGVLTFDKIKKMFQNLFYTEVSENEKIYIKLPNLYTSYELEKILDVVDLCTLELVNLKDEDSNSVIEKSLEKLSTELKQTKISIESLEAKINSLPIQQNSKDVDKELLALQKSKELAQDVQPTKEAPKDSTNSNKQLSSKEINILIKIIKKSKIELLSIKQNNLELKQKTNQKLSSITSYIQTLEQQLNVQTDAVRNMINEGKKRIAENQDSIFKRIDDLQLNIEDLKIDIIQRRSRPTENRLNHITTEIENINKEIQSEREFIMKVKPTWKQNWEKELSNIVKEQKMLKEHEDVIENYTQDISEVSKFNEQILKLLNLRSKQKNRPLSLSKSKNFEDDEFIRESVLNEINCIEIDHNKRLLAIKHNKNIRRIEVQNQINEFQKELSEFSDHNKLNKTGGTVEIDKKRKKQDEINLKLMFQTS